MLTIEHLTKTYGDTKAVDDLSLHIAPGEIYGFIGHNGAGKTTTLKSCAGILPFDQGQIRIDGEPMMTDNGYLKTDKTGNGAWYGDAAQWALQWVLNNRNVTCVLSGMNDIKQLEDNLAIADNTSPMSMSFEELEVVERVKRVMRVSLKINCSTCGYCMPCPQGVNIPECMKIYNEKYLFNHKGFFNTSFIDYFQYVGGVMGKQASAGMCNACGKCLRKCPQKLDIIDELNTVKKEFEFPGFKFMVSFIRVVGFPVYKFLLKILNR